MKIRCSVLLTMALCLSAFSQEILIARGLAGPKGEPQSSYDNFSKTITRRLDACGITYKTTTDDKISADLLKGIKVLVFPYNRSLSDNAWNHVKAFSEAGGKIVAFYTNDGRLNALLGIESLTYINKPMADVNAMALDSRIISAMPTKLNQASHNCLQPKILPGTMILGRWLDKDDKDIRLTAATYNKNGVFVSHVYMDQDSSNGARFITALFGHFIPDIWKKSAQNKMASIGKLGGMKNLQELTDRIRKSENKQANIAVSEAAKQEEKAKLLFTQGQFSQALDTATLAAQKANDAFMATCPSRGAELRGAWIHSAYGLKGVSWDECIKTLAKNGFNAIFPNMCWGYVADYKSQVLPVHPDVETRGDQIEECLKACRKYGVEIHVWKVNWNMGHRTPSHLVDKMRNSGRTQVTKDGGETKYLAPHIQENFQLERDAMLEIVRKYKVDGIHFDYIRYPDSKCDYSDSAREAFQLAYKTTVKKWPEDCLVDGKLYKSFTEWRKSNITRLVQTVYKEAKKIRKDIKVSAAVFANWEGAPEWVGQDAENWLANGYLDFVCPMDYSDSHDSYKLWIEHQIPIAQRYGIPIYPGIGSYLHTTPNQTAEQIQMARKAGADGFVCFDLRSSFANTWLPQLRAGTTSLPAGSTLPHHSQKVKFIVPPGQPGMDGALILGDTCKVTAQLPPQIPFSKSLQVSLELNGSDIKSGEIQHSFKGKNLEFTFTAYAPGFYRVRLFDSKHNFISRSPSIRVLNEKEAEEMRIKNGPPLFQNNGGVRVAIWHDDAYGAEILLKELKNMKGMDVAVLHNLKPESLNICQVIILPQPRRRTQLFKDAKTTDALKAFMKNGGGIITTHAMVGIRGFINLAPTVIPQPLEQPIPGSDWKTAGRHPITHGIPNDIQKSTFGDMIGFRTAPGATRILNSTDGTCVMAVGQVGRGRYAACGMGLAIGNNDKDTQITKVERILLENTILWLGKKIR